MEEVAALILAGVEGSKDSRIQGSKVPRFRGSEVSSFSFRDSTAHPAPKLNTYLRDCEINVRIRGINDEVFAVPGVVFAIQDLLPSRQLQTRNISLTVLYPTTVLNLIRAHDFDFQNFRPHTASYFTPSLARDSNWIDTIRDDGAACAKIFLRDGVRGTVAGVVHRSGELAGVPQRLLNGVDAHVYGADLAR